MTRMRPRSISGQPSAAAPADLDAVYREHAARVARWAAHLGGPALDIEDLVHEVFLVVQRRLAESRGDAPLTTWLYRITERVVRDARRKDRVRRWLNGARWTDVVRATAPAHLAPVDEIERRQDAARVYRAFDRLPDRYRTLLVLFELEGLTGEEIAALTGVKLATVWVRLHRARARFLEALGPGGARGDDGDA